MDKRLAGSTTSAGQVGSRSIIDCIIHHQTDLLFTIISIDPKVYLDGAFLFIPIACRS
jgi:hypothetical protein